MKKKRSLRKIKNMMLRETRGSFLAPFLVPLLLLTYDFPAEFNNIFIIVTSIVGPLVGLLFLRAYLRANTRYKESLKHVKPSFRTKLIPSSSITEINGPKITSDNKPQRFPPISELQQKSYSKPISEFSQFKAEEVKSIQPTSDKREEKLKVTSYTCKVCGNELIKKASYCPYCDKSF